MNEYRKQIHVIFQSANGENQRWLDYCREEPLGTLTQVEAWAAEQCRKLETRHAPVGFRYRIEIW